MPSLPYTYVLQASASAGVLYHNQSFDTINDLVVTFDYACFGTAVSGNEGFSVFFVNAAPGSLIGGGGPGPGLCYSPVSGLSSVGGTSLSSFSGVDYSALGIGFDLTGNFSTSAYGVSAGLSVPVPNSISIRDNYDNGYGLLYNSGNLSGSNYPFDYTFYQQVSALTAIQALEYDRIRVRLTDFGQRVLIDIKRPSDQYFTNFVDYLLPTTSWWPDIVYCCLGFATGDGSTVFKIKNFNINGLYLSEYRLWQYNLDSNTLSGSYFQPVSSSTPTTSISLRVDQDITSTNIPPFNTGPLLSTPLIIVSPAGIEGLVAGDNYILITETYNDFKAL